MKRNVDITGGSSRKFRLSATLLAALASVLAATTADAKPPAWDQVANIRKSATYLAELQKTRGAGGAYQHISSCYKTHELASNYSAAFEGCLVLDYIHSKITAAVYQQVPAAERQKMGAPEPEALVNAMSQRLAGGFAHYAIADADAKAFLALVEKHGIPAFTKARFPDAAGKGGTQNKTN